MNAQAGGAPDGVRAAEIAAFLGRSCTGDEQLIVREPRPVGELVPQALSFMKRYEAAWVEGLRAAPATALIIALESLREHCADLPQTFIYSPTPRLDFARAVWRFFPPDEGAAGLPAQGIHPTAVVDPRAEIDPSVRIGAYAVIDRCRLGPNVIVHPHVHVFSHVEARANVILWHGCTIGTHGFGFELAPEGRWVRIPHLGGVLLEEDVEVFPHANIDQAAVGTTHVGQGTKIDHYCHIGHAVQIGRHAIITAGAILAGSSRVGDYTWIGPNSNVLNTKTVGRNVMVGMGSVVINDVPDDVIVAGVPAKVLRPNKPLPFVVPDSAK
ncbi:MAG: hypothetical protein PVJ57_04205 [Phycisphaerae bacterium]|jgi:UDP-3-O-[3-hydroxymyristoyl] glucosamine N-acyltransferase